MSRPPCSPIDPHREERRSPHPLPLSPYAVILCGTLGIIHLAGCSGESLVAVSGEVSYEGNAVEIGEIRFTPIEKTPGPATGSAIEGGRYAVSAERGLLQGGTYLIHIEGMKKSGRRAPNPITGTSIELMENFIPVEYNAESTLQVTINDGSSSQQLDFRLPQSP